MFYGIKKQPQTRKKRRRECIGLDWLTICFLHDKTTFERIRDNKNDKTMWEDFYTYRITNESDEDTQVVNVIIPFADDDHRTLGTLSIHNGKQHEGQAFFKIENKALYTGLTHLLPYVAGKLQLQFNNFTRMDIAITSTYNYVRAIRQSVHNYEGLEMYYKGMKVPNPETTLKDFIEIYPRNRKRRINSPTLVFGHKKTEGIHCLVYDKKRELAEQSIFKTEYLDEWLGFPYENLFRIEVELRNTQIRSLCKAGAKICEDWGHGENLIYQLQNEYFLTFLFKKSLSRVLYFKHNGKRVEVWDL